MDLKVEGGFPLRGEIEISGAKNAAMKMIAAATLTEEEVELKSVPEILDVHTMLAIFKKLGGQVKRIAPGHYKLCGKNIKRPVLDNSLVSRLRGAVVFLGPLLARFKEVVLPFPGGCHIGARPITTHIKLFQDLGAEVEEQDGIYHFKLSRVKNRKVVLDEMSVTATENAILFASYFKEPIEFRVVAIEPEIIDLIELLEKMGAEVKGKGTPFVTVRRRAKKLKGVSHTVIPDRIETGTWAVLAAVSRGEIKLANIKPETLDSFFNKMKQARVELQFEKGCLTVSSSGYFKPVNLDTRTYPGFPTDLQAPFSVLMTQAEGASRIFETLFEDRLQYLKELKRMGANVEIVDTHTALIYGPTVLYGKTIHSLDLRAGATLILASLIAHGTSLIKNIEIVDRGYENWEAKLKAIGAKIKKIK